MGEVDRREIEVLPLLATSPSNPREERRMESDGAKEAERLRAPLRLSIHQLSPPSIPSLRRARNREGKEWSERG